MRTRRLSVSAIEKGTVIDHIPAGKALEVVRLLKLDQHGGRITVGLNLDSKSFGRKDLIKIEDRALSPGEANHIAVLAPDATIAIIEDFDVIRKFKVVLPSELRDAIPCPNPICITNHESVPTHFSVQPQRNGSKMTCNYCRYGFRLGQNKGA